MNLRVGGDLGKIAAYQGKMMLVVQCPDATNPRQAAFVAHMTAQCVTRVGWINDESFLMKNLHGMTDKPWLGVERMYLEVLAHGSNNRSGDCLV
jgi:hypothetical protein